MADDSGRPIRWGRALLASIAAEVALIVVAVAVGATTADPIVALNLVTPPASLLVFIPAGYWTAKPVPQSAILNGALPGVIGALFYIVLTLIAWAAVKGFDLAGTLRPAYLLAHGLKVVGGVIGGWLLARKTYR